MLAFRNRIRHRGHLRAAAFLGRMNWVSQRAVFLQQGPYGEGSRPLIPQHVQWMGFSIANFGFETSYRQPLPCANLRR